MKILLKDFTLTFVTQVNKCHVAVRVADKNPTTNSTALCKINL